ncbi:UNVERIFIED_CONTAM: hypothetical protein HDU68_008700 [Siphonaria sp. JEL0065]|nr:hypothetical protein HDU68_008700 [Siphonaria sp. JEL0065]
MYLIGSSKSNKRLLIDTGNGHLDSPLPFKANSIKVSSVILSHSHGGHANGLLSLGSVLGDRTPLLKFKSGGDSVDVRDKGKTGDLRFVNHGASIVLHEKEPLNEKKGPSGGIDSSLEVIHTPGHSADSISLWLKEEQCLFTGDSVSNAPFDPAVHPTLHLIENLDLYISSLKKLSALGPRVVFPGHGDVITKGIDYISQAQECQTKTASAIQSLVFHNHAINAFQITQHLLKHGLQSTLAPFNKNTPTTAPHSIILEGTIKQHLLNLEKRGLVQRVHAARDETQNVSEAQKNMRGPGGLTYSTIFDAVKSSRQRDWVDNKKEGDQEQVFRVREKVHPAHFWISLSNQVGWTAKL